MFYGNNHDFLQICTGKSDETENGKKNYSGDGGERCSGKFGKRKMQLRLMRQNHFWKRAGRGVLAVNGDDGYPYAIPLNYFYDRDERKIYFHGARAGHKVDALRAIVIRCALRFTEMRRSGRKPGRRICRARSSSADAACWRTAVRRRNGPVETVCDEILPG